MWLARSGESIEGARWRVFISHTSELRTFPKEASYVAAVERAVSAAGHVIVDMADFAAADEVPAQVCAERVRGCDVYVGVLGTRYGSPVRDRAGVSYTELEFDTATEAGLERLVFLLDIDADNVGIPPSALIDRDYGARQDAFRRRVQDGGLLTRSFADPAELGQQVERSLRDLAQTRSRLGGRILHGHVPGRPLDEVTDPFALEVHRPIELEDTQPELPSLPTYVPREHDVQLARVVRAAAEGSSGIAVLVGGSSTGKTRACWEALQVLREQPEQWRLWHPIDPSRPDAALRELPFIGPRTVVWLNDAQFYLDVVDGGLGERVAAGLRELLRDRARARAPVLILATLWPQFWDGLTSRPVAGDDLHAHARELLADHDITVPASFTAAQLRRLSKARDVRVAYAAAATQDGRVLQFVAGAPELLARYRNSPPAASALIQAAMDARRLGMGIGLPLAFLRAAAPGYLTDTEWDALSEDWLERALAYTAVPCKGVLGPITRIRPRSSESLVSQPGHRFSAEPTAGNPASITVMPSYRLADYLDQHGRHGRRSQLPPAAFWSAAAEYASPGDQARLGDAAHARGLFRIAAQLHKNAAAAGNLQSIFFFSDTPYYLREDARPVRWAIEHSPLDDPYAMAWLLDRLRESGADEHVAALLHRTPAAHVRLDDPDGVVWLLDNLREAGVEGQVAMLAERAAAHAPLDSPGAIAWLLDKLRELGAEEQVSMLLDRDPAAHVRLDDPDGVAALLESLREAGIGKQVTILAERAAAHVPVDDPGAIAWLLDKLREVGAQGRVTMLAERAAAHVPLDDQYAVTALLGTLAEAGMRQQATALAERAAAHVPLHDPGAVARLLGILAEAGMAQQATALAERAAAHVPLHDPAAVAWLLGKLAEAGMAQQATALAERAAAHVPLHDPAAVAWLLGKLAEAGMEEQATTLLRRNPAAHVRLDDPGGLSWLLDRLREASEDQQITVLAERAADIRLDDVGAMARLLDNLREAGMQEQVTTLLHRDPAAHVRLDDPDAVAGLLDSLGRANAEEQVTALLQRDPAAQMRLDNPDSIAGLLDSLGRANAMQQVTALAARAAAQILGDDAVLDSLTGARKGAFGVARWR